jgi:hypothetical protein
MNKLDVYWFGRPWSVIQLKNAALYSDKITMCPLMYQAKYIKKHTKGKGVDPYSIYCAAGLAEEEIKSTINIFENAGFLKIDGNVFDQNRWQLVGKMLDAEIGNEELSNAILEIYMDSEPVRDLIEVNKFLSEGVLRDKDFAKNCSLPIENLEETLVEIILSFQHAFYMGLIGAIEKEACPLTDDEIFTKIIQLKSNAKFLSKLNKDEITVLGDADYRVNTYTASKVINLTVPAFEKIPPEKIIEVRDNEKQSLEKFRNEIYVFNKGIENISKDPSQVKERIDKKIEDAIIPRIKDLESAIENSYYDFLKRLGPDLVKLGAASLVGYSINVYAFLIALGGASTPLLKDTWQYLIEEIRYKRNSLYYLMRVKEISKKYTI